MKWFAVRSLYKFGVKKDGKNIFEERIVCFGAPDFDVAATRAREEAETYAKDNDFELHEEQLVYKQDGESLIDCYEVWSELYESYESIHVFFDAKYRRFLYEPEID